MVYTGTASKENSFNVDRERKDSNGQTKTPRFAPSHEHPDAGTADRHGEEFVEEFVTGLPAVDGTIETHNISENVEKRPAALAKETCATSAKELVAPSSKGTSSKGTSSKETCADRKSALEIELRPKTPILKRLERSSMAKYGVSSLSLSFSLSRCLSVCLSLSLSFYLSLFIPPSLFLSLSLSLSLFFCLPLSLARARARALSLSFVFVRARSLSFNQHTYH